MIVMTKKCGRFLSVCVCVCMMGLVGLIVTLSSAKAEEPLFTSEALTPAYKLYGYEPELCSKLLNILNLPENENYLETWRNNKARPLFYIPEDNKEFKALEWEKADVEEFKAALPYVYENYMMFFSKSADKDYKFMEIKKAEAALFHPDNI